MNNEETPGTVPTPEPTPSTTPDTTTPVQEGSAGAWMPKAQYDAHTAELKKQQTDERNTSKTVRAFYILLAISGLLLFILYLGMLIWPFHYGSRSECSGQTFAGFAFLLNPAGYLMLLIAGIVGATVRRKGVRALGISFIIISPIAWFITGFAILASILCGI